MLSRCHALTPYFDKEPGKLFIFTESSSDGGKQCANAEPLKLPMLVHSRISCS
jgi:hypothetical protein